MAIVLSSSWEILNRIHTCTQRKGNWEHLSFLSVNFKWSFRGFVVLHDIMWDNLIN